MIRYSVLIPERDNGQAVAEQISDLQSVMRRLVLPYEIICIDDGSADLHLSPLKQLLDQPGVRILRFDRPAGLSAALSAGVAAARGEIVITIESGIRYQAGQIPDLISRLSRGDLVIGRRLRGRLAKGCERVTRLPRWLLLGLDAKDPDCLFWAARHEAVANLDLARGMFRYVPTLVAMRGYRVHELVVDATGRGCNLSDARPNPLDLLAVWWLKRRRQPHPVRELTLENLRHPPLRLVESESRSSETVPPVTEEHALRRESA